MTLTWERPYSSRLITGYEYRQKEGTGSFGNWMAVPNSERFTRSYTVSNLTNDTEYTFEVRAESDVGKGAAASASATPNPPPPLTNTAPAAPVIKGMIINDSKLRVGWDLSLGIVVPGDRLNEVVSSFKIQWKSGSQEYDSSRQNVHTVEPQSSGTGTSFLYTSHEITGLTNGVEYTVRIIATNAHGDGPPSAEKTGTPNAKPEQLRQFIEDDIVEAYESSFPWLRDTWDYMKTNNVPLYVRDYGSSRMSI